MLKLLVEIELNKPLLRGTKIKLDDELVWVDFRYEQLPNFCFYCRKIGHPEKNCERKMMDFRGNSICEGQYGGMAKSELTKRGKERGTI